MRVSSAVLTSHFGDGSPTNQDWPRALLGWAEMRRRPYRRSSSRSCDRALMLVIFLSHKSTSRINLSSNQACPRVGPLEPAELPGDRPESQAGVTACISAMRWGEPLVRLGRQIGETNPILPKWQSATVQLLATATNEPNEGVVTPAKVAWSATNEANEADEEPGTVTNEPNRSAHPFRYWWNVTNEANVRDQAPSVRQTDQ
jgi:hypothetical protein